MVAELRYQRPIADTTDVLAIVDSEVQLSRLQFLRGKEMSIRNIYKQSNRIHVYNDVEFQEINARFERGFCQETIPSRTGIRLVAEYCRACARRGRRWWWRRWWCRWSRCW
jgi:hypothetical protein